MDNTGDSRHAWAEMRPGERFVLILGMIKDGHPSISNQTKRLLCHLGQHPQCLRWLLRENIESLPVESNKVANWALDLEKKGFITRHKNEDTLVCGKKQSLGEANSKIPYLTENGESRYSNLVKKHSLNLKLLPDWFLFLCLDEKILLPNQSIKHYPLPVSIRDLRPTNKETIEIEEINSEEPIRNKNLVSNISNFSYKDLSRLLREECGIHLLIGGAGSGKTQMLQATTKAWSMPHVADEELSIVHTTLSCRKYTEYLVEKETPPEDEDAFEQWIKQSELNSNHPPEPDSSDEEEWAEYQRKCARINLKNTIETLENYIFDNYIRHLPNTTSKDTPLRMLKEAQPSIALFVDGLDEISNEYRNRILTQLNLLVEKNPQHRVLIASRPIQTPEQFQPELQTLIQLMELPKNWPSKDSLNLHQADSSLQIEGWPNGLQRTPLAWMLVRATQDKTSEGASEAEILDQYLDDCMEAALDRKKPPHSKKEMWGILRRTALWHSELGLREFCEIPEGFDDKDSVTVWNDTTLWAYLHMQILQEVSGWRISGFEHMTVAEETYQFSHRRIQEYLASQSFNRLEDFFEWFDHKKLQNPDWCWPVVRDVSLRLNAREEIIEYLQSLDEDILGHREGLINFLKGENDQLLPRGIPKNHKKVNMMVEIKSLDGRVHEYPQSESEESKQKVERIVQTLHLLEKQGHDDPESRVDWVKSFGLEPTFLQLLTHKLLELGNRKRIENIVETQPERAIHFWEYFTKLLWLSKKPTAQELSEFAKPFENNFLKYNWDNDEWIEPWISARTFTLLDLDTKNDVILETYRMNRRNRVPFEGPERQLVHFLDQLGLSIFSLEISWMFGFETSTYTYNRWLRIFNIDSYQRVYNDNDYFLQGLGWILTLCQDIRSRPILDEGPWPRIRHPRFKEQRLHSTIPNAPNSPTDILDMMENSAPIIGKITINTSASRFELKEMLDAAEESNRIELLKEWLCMKPDFYFEPEEVSGLPMGELLNVYKNQFLEHWCLSPYMQGDVPSLKDYPWFEELWD